MNVAEVYWISRKSRYSRWLSEAQERLTPARERSFHAESTAEGSLRCRPTNRAAWQPTAADTPGRSQGCRIWRETVVVKVGLVTKLQAVAAINGDQLSSGVAGQTGTQEHRHACNLLGLAKAPQREVLLHAVDPVLVEHSLLP